MGQRDLGRRSHGARIYPEEGAQQEDPKDLEVTVDSGPTALRWELSSRQLALGASRFQQAALP